MDWWSAYMNLKARSSPHELAFGVELGPSAISLHGIEPRVHSVWAPVHTPIECRREGSVRVGLDAISLCYEARVYSVWAPGPRSESELGVKGVLSGLESHIGRRIFLIRLYGLG
ncbi:hypothetical protein HAX54_035900 [Datura stramonium]|uniref:Uncharacterized protein n=1 Tax=Datura stramonium TaxID=4076 RepID=A0ABS8SFX4_DATST|nr:hypothetical protein [Datura stramonium]